MASPGKTPLTRTPRFLLATAEVQTFEASPNLATQSIPLYGSFEAGEQGVETWDFAVRMKILGASVRVTKALADTDAGLVLFTDNAGNPVASLSIPLSTIRGTEYGLTFSPQTVLPIGSNYCSVTTSKTTAGGKIKVTLYCLPCGDI